MTCFSFTKTDIFLGSQKAVQLSQSSQQRSPSEASADSQGSSVEFFASPRLHRKKSSDKANKRLTEDIRENFYGFCEATGETECRSQKAFSELSSKMKERKACMARRLLDFQIMVIAEDADSEEELRDRILQGDLQRFWLSHTSKKFGKFLSTIGKLYDRLHDKFDKRYLLSLLSSSLSFGEVQEIIPGLTNYQFVTAKKTLFVEVKAERQPHLKERYDYRKVNRFIEFITRYTYCFFCFSMLIPFIAVLLYRSVCLMEGSCEDLIQEMNSSFQKR